MSKYVQIQTKCYVASRTCLDIRIGLKHLIYNSRTCKQHVAFVASLVLCPNAKLLNKKIIIIKMLAKILYKIICGVLNYFSFLQI